MDTMGFMELTSIAAGIELADAMLKAANVELIFARASCPGKYYIMLTGNVDAVKSAIKEGECLGKGFVVDSIVLSKIHPQVIKAINMTAAPENIKSIGVMEFFSVTHALISADTAVKASNVELMDIRLGTGIGGKSFVVLTGEPTAVETAIKSGAAKAAEAGMLVNKVIINRPKKELIESLF